MAEVTRPTRPGSNGPGHPGNGSPRPPSGDGNKKLGQLLIERSVITGEQLIRAIQSQRVVGGRLGTCLLEMDVLSEDQLLDALALQLQVPSAGVERLRGIEPDVLGLLPNKVAARCLAIPFDATKYEVRIATLFVRNLKLLDEIQFCCNRRVIPYIASEVRLFEALEKYYGVEMPRRFNHLLDRLNRSRYMWDESAKLLLGEAESDVVWTSPDQAFGAVPTMKAQLGDRLIVAPSARTPSAPSPALPLRSVKVEPVIETRQAQPTRPAPVAAGTPTNTQPNGPRSAPSPAAPMVSAAAAIVPSAPISPARVPQDPKTTNSEPQQQTRPGPLPSTPIVQPAIQAPAVEKTAAAPKNVPATWTAPTPESLWTLDQVDRMLSAEADLERVADIVLRFAAQRFSRTALFKVRQDKIQGWQFRGGEIDERLFKALEISLALPSIFFNLNQGTPFFVGALPPMAAHRQLAQTWGGLLPQDCLLLGLRVRERLVAALYGDRGALGLHGLDIEGLKQLAGKASAALELCILRKKLQSV